jgi:hypothetical protein
MRAVADLTQRRAERSAAHQRHNVLRTDNWLDEFLGFADKDL